jgi:putative transposase
MLKSFQYRLYPTQDQCILLNKHIGAARFIFNLALETKQYAWATARINLSCFDLQKQIKDLKKDCEWLKEVNSQSLQQAISNLDRAYMGFFKGQTKFPKFKNKSNAGSFNIPQSISFKNGKLVIPKFQNGISVLLHRSIKGAIRQATIKKTPTGKYFISILCETGESLKPKAKIEECSTTGLDLGIKSFAVTSSGKVYENPKFLRNAQSRLRFLQRKYSRHKGKRTKHRLTIAYEKVTNKRKDFLHKLSTELIRDNQSISIETLQVSNMLKNHNLAQSISDASWGAFVRMLEYKAIWNGKNILKIGTFEPSSKTCSCCGNINNCLTLQEREWTCSRCGSLLDRDVNAAINIKMISLKSNLSVERRLKNHGQLPTLVGASTHEANRKNPIL